MVRNLFPLTISEEMVGHKLGEFSPTRQFHGHTPADKKAKADEGVIKGSPATKPASSPACSKTKR